MLLTLWFLVRRPCRQCAAHRPSTEPLSWAPPPHGSRNRVRARVPQCRLTRGSGRTSGARSLGPALIAWAPTKRAEATLAMRRASAWPGARLCPGLRLRRLVLCTRRGQLDRRATPHSTRSGPPEGTTPAAAGRLGRATTPRPRTAAGPAPWATARGMASARRLNEKPRTRLAATGALGGRQRPACAA